MTEVLLIAAAKPQLGVLADSVRRFNSHGARVRLAGTFHLESSSEEIAALDLTELHQLPRSLTHRSQALRRKARTSTVGMRVWLQARRNPWLRSHARGADVLVALDPGAVYTVWRLSQYNRSAEALFGLTPALKAVERLGARGVAARRPVLPPLGALARDVRRSVDGLPAALLRTATARPVMRSTVGARLWRGAVTAPGLPTRVRTVTARYVAEGMQWAGRTSGAAMVLADAASRTRDPALRAQLLDEGATKELSNGVAPRHLDRALAALLSHADGEFAAGRPGTAAAALDRALVLAFHRVLHIDQLSSPLAVDAEGFVAPLHGAETMRELSRGQGRRTPPERAPGHRPLRLLVTTSANDNFLHHVLEHFGNHPDVELRYLDLAASKHLKRIAWAGRRMLEDRLSGGTSDFQEEVERLMRPYLDWADTVFLDWSVGPAPILTTIDPGTTRIVVRLHSYEAFTRWPHMTDFSRVDDLVFVAPHVRDLVTSLVPQLRGGQAPRTHILDNAMDLTAFARPKPAEARFDLGLIGVGQVAKDPRWAVDVLERVRRHDDRYRLVMVGGDMDAKTSRATREYRRAFEKEIAALSESGAVVRRGPTDDVPSELAGIGTILSSSVREGCHVGLMEGAASGAVPVVRDWPFYAGKPNGARTLYPEDWVVGSPEEAAERVLQTTATEEAWREAGKLAAEHALSVWDWSVVSRQFDKLLLEGDRDAPAQAPTEKKSAR
ncbi:glycosyltransferase [Streptomyces pacificus]|uniref:Glycosyltransferase family 1 protein n=1 Tax=Streptomyces pacificus TaxID=2705029 RepID=A0A6A0AQG5_9ACTN|nr:glycosyltransferase [Streptomyces pacificus]GFH34114.1 glycosyltransferase family 1 protein [Streptomyces pacificus]